MAHEKTVHGGFFEKLHVHFSKRTYSKKQGGVILYESKECLLLLYTLAHIEDPTLIRRKWLLLKELRFPP